VKKLIFILFILFSCEYDTCIFPGHGEYGENVLYENKTEFVGSYRSDKTWYSLRTEIPVRIVIEQISGLWYVSITDGTWIYTTFDGSQEFRSDCGDKRMFFDESGSAIVKYYINDKKYLEKIIYWEYFDN